MNLGHNRKTNLEDDAGFLAAYRMNFEGKVRTGGEEEFRSIQQAARILSRQGKHYEVLKPFVHIDKALSSRHWANHHLRPPRRPFQLCRP